MIVKTMDRNITHVLMDNNSIVAAEHVFDVMRHVQTSPLKVLVKGWHHWVTMVDGTLDVTNNYYRVTDFNLRSINAGYPLVLCVTPEEIAE